MLPKFLASHPAFGAGLTRVLPEWEGTAANVLAISPQKKLPAKVAKLLELTKASFAARLALMEEAKLD